MPGSGWLWISILAFFTLALWYIFANVYIDTLVPFILKVQTGPMRNGGELGISFNVAIFQVKFLVLEIGQC